MVRKSKAVKKQQYAEALWLQQGDPYEGYTDSELNDEREELL